MGGQAAETRASQPSQSRYRTASRFRGESRLDDRDLLNILLEQGAQSVGIICPDAGALKLSSNWQVITGADSVAAEGEAIFDLLHPQHADKFKKRLREFLHKEKPVTVNYQVLRADDTWRWVEFTLTRKYGDAVVCLMRDVTGETKDRQQLHKATLESELALKSRSEFLAHLSHELRTPLNAILGFTQMIEHKVYGELGDERYTDYMANIRESGQALLSKLGDLFEIAYIDAGYASLNEESVQLDELFAQAIEILSHHAFTQQVRIQARPAPFTVRGDRLKLLKVLLCMVSNAIKFNRSEGQVTLGAEMHRLKGLVITISDTGQGIADRQLEHIQTMFNHEESFLARDRNHEGTGLALAGELVRMHDGSIEVETEIGEGSHFAIVLPRDRLVRAQAKKTEAA